MDEVEQLRRQLDDTRQRFASMFDNTTDAMAMYGTDGKLQRANASAIAMIGSNPESIGGDFTQHIAPDYHAAAVGSFERALAGDSSELDQSLIAMDGRMIPVIATYAPIIVSGNVVGVVATAKDVSIQRRSEEQLLLSRERFRALFELHPDAIVLLATTGRILQINQAMESLVGCPTEGLVGKQLDVLFSPLELAVAQDYFSQALRRETVRFATEILAADGSSIDVEADGIPTLVRGEVGGVFLVVKDVRRQRALEYRERTQRERLRAVALLAAAHADDVTHQIDETLEFAARSLEFEAVAVAVLVDDELEIIHGAGETYSVGHRLPFAESYNRLIYGTNDLLVITDADNAEWKNDIARRKHPWRQVVSTTVYSGGDAMGSITFTSTKPRATDFDEGDRGFVRVVAALLGASLERKRREQQLIDLAFVDALTNLPNRAYFAEQLVTAIARVRRGKGTIGVHYIDLDGFKEVNDTFGHEAGDRVLTIIARRIKAVVRESDVAARLGGDEFVVLQGDCDGDEGALLLGRRLIAAASEPIPLSAGAVANIGASVGIARAPKDSVDADDLVRRADRAMYHAKNAGKGRVVLYEPDFDLPM